MNLRLTGRVSRLAAIGAILLGSASCVEIDETLGESLIPTDQKWNVYPQDPVDLEGITLEMADSLTAFSTSRFTFGAINDGSLLGSSRKGTSFTLIPLWDTLDFGRNTKVRQFHFTATRDTLSVLYDNEERILQNVYVSELKKPLDSTIIYASSLSNPGIFNEYVDTGNRITIGTPVYSGGDSLSFDFSLEYARKVIEQIDKAQKAGQLDSVTNYLKYVPGIYITSDEPVGNGGRINMFDIAINNSSGYVTGNYAELKFTAEYDHSDEPVDTSFLFMFGASDYIRIDDSGNVTYPTHFAFNASEHDTGESFVDDWKSGSRDNLYVEGGSGLKPVVKAEEIKSILEELIAKENIKDISQVVVNKATIMLPYDVAGDYARLDKYPDILSPTVRISSSEGDYVTYAGITDASISSENQGNINRSLNRYSPDISHHVQAILNLDRNAEDYEKTIRNYDIWFLIMAEEVVEDNTYDSSSYYSNYPYSSYYNSMMYDPYGYGYGGYGGYGYGGYGYGYGSYGYGYGSNYYNYAMMAAYYSSMYDTSSTVETSVELDKDRYYNAVLKGPGSSGAKPQLKVTFSAPKSAE